MGAAFGSENSAKSWDELATEMVENKSETVCNCASKCATCTCDADKKEEE